MATPMSRQPQRNSNDEALEILRRLEPVITNLHREQVEQRRELTEQRSELSQQRQILTKLNDNVMDLREDVAELKGRVGGIEAQLRHVPTIWQIVGAMTAINAVSIGTAFGIVKLILSFL